MVPEHHAASHPAGLHLPATELDVRAGRLVGVAVLKDIRRVAPRSRPRLALAASCQLPLRIFRRLRTSFALWQSSGPWGQVLQSYIVRRTPLRRGIIGGGRMLDCKT